MDGILKFLQSLPGPLAAFFAVAFFTQRPRADVMLTDSDPTIRFVGHAIYWAFPICVAIAGFAVFVIVVKWMKEKSEHNERQDRKRAQNEEVESFIRDRSTAAKDILLHIHFNQIQFDGPKPLRVDKKFTLAIEELASVGMIQVDGTLMDGIRVSIPRDRWDFFCQKGLDLLFSGEHRPSHNDRTKYEMVRAQKHGAS